MRIGVHSLPPRNVWVPFLTRILALLSGTFGSALLGFVTQLLLARALNVADYGGLAALLAMVNIVGTFAGYGVGWFWLQVFGREGVGRISVGHADNPADRHRLRDGGRSAGRIWCPDSSRAAHIFASRPAASRAGSSGAEPGGDDRRAAPARRTLFDPRRMAVPDPDGAIGGCRPANRNRLQGPAPFVGRLRAGRAHCDLDRRPIAQSGPPGSDPAGRPRCRRGVRRPVDRPPIVGRILRGTPFCFSAQFSTSLFRRASLWSSNAVSEVRPPPSTTWPS